MIRAKGLTMHYGPVVALDDVSFDVNKGEIVGLLGPNGAGKSTAMKILTTYLYPTRGTAEVAGLDVLSDPLNVRRKIGYLPEVLPLYLDMEVRTYLHFVARARGLSGSQLKQRTEEVIDKCGLRPMFRKIVRELSKGYRQRTALAQALIHNPEVIILDEPTSGLDPHQILEIRHLIDALAKDKTVILSTHILQEVEATADRIVIINQGRIVGNGTVAELRAQVKKQERFAVGVAGAPAEEVERLLSGVGGVTRVVREDHTAEAACASFTVFSRLGAAPWQEINQVARERKWELRELREKPPTLEETFLSLTERQAETALN